MAGLSQLLSPSSSAYTTDNLQQKIKNTKILIFVLQRKIIQRLLGMHYWGKQVHVSSKLTIHTLAFSCFSSSPSLLLLLSNLPSFPFFFLWCFSLFFWSPNLGIQLFPCCVWWWRWCSVIFLYAEFAISFTLVVNERSLFAEWVVSFEGLWPLASGWTWWSGWASGLWHWTEAMELELRECLGIICVLGLFALRLGWGVNTHTHIVIWVSGIPSPLLSIAPLFFFHSQKFVIPLFSIVGILLFPAHNHFYRGSCRCRCWNLPN